MISHTHRSGQKQPRDDFNQGRKGRRGGESISFNGLGSLHFWPRIGCVVIRYHQVAAEAHFCCCRVLIVGAHLERKRRKREEVPNGATPINYLDQELSRCLSGRRVFFLLFSSLCFVFGGPSIDSLFIRNSRPKNVIRRV